MMKRISSLLLIFIMLGCLLPAGVLAEDAENGIIVIEAEDYFDTEFNVTVETGTTELSGGKALVMTEVYNPAKTNTIEYVFEAEQAGTYTLEVVSSITKVSYTSDFTVHIDNQEPVSLKGAKKLADVTCATWPDVMKRYSGGSWKLSSGKHTLTVTVDTEDTIKNGNVLVYLDCFKLINEAAGGFDILGIEPINPASVFEDGSSVAFDINFNSAAGNNVKYAYVVKDAWGYTKLRGEFTVMPGSTSYRLNLGNYGKGWYMLYLLDYDTKAEIGKKASFSVVVPLSERTVEDSPFATDAATQFLVSDVEDVKELASAMKYAGIQWARERYYWTATQYDADVVESRIDAISNEGIKLLDYFGTAPADQKQFNGDLFELYDMQKGFVERYGDRIDNFEVWNEQDWGYGDSPADVYGAFYKAAAIATADANPNVMKSFGGFAQRPYVVTYMDLLMQNDVMDYTDTYGHHRHMDMYTGEFRTLDTTAIGAHTATAWAYDNEKQVWVTEAGLRSYLKDGNTELDQVQLNRQAKFAIISTVESLSKGTNKHFWFVWPHYFEGDAEMGTFYSDITPFPVYSSIATMTAVLGEAEYKGKLENLPVGAEGYMFNNGTDDVAVVWAYSPVYYQYEASSPVTVTDFVGGEQTVEPLNGIINMPITYYPIFITFNGLSSEKNYMPESYEVYDNAPVTFEDNDKIVFQQQWANQDLKAAKADGYDLTVDGNEITLAVYNFSDKTMEGTINGITSDCFVLDKASVDFSLAPMSRTDLTFYVNQSETAYEGETGYVKFNGTLSDGSPISSSVAAAYIHEETIETGEITPIPDFTNTSLWNLKNVGPTGTVKITEATDDTLTFKVNFNGGNLWAYPQFLVEDTSIFEGTAGISFLIEVAESHEKCSTNVFCYMKDGRQYYLGDLNSVKFQAGEQRITALWNKMKLFSAPNGRDNVSTFDPKDIQYLSIGGNFGLDDVQPYTIKQVGYFYSDHPSHQLTKSDGVVLSGIESGKEYNQGLIPKLIATLPEDNYTDISVYIMNKKYDNFTVEGNTVTVDFTGIERGGYTVMVVGKTDMNYAQRKTISFTVK